MNLPFKDKVVLVFSQPLKEMTPAKHASQICEDFGAKSLTIEYLPAMGPLYEGEQTEIQSKQDKLILNLKNKKISNFVLDRVIPKVDILLESNRPGVMEKFGLGPESVHAINPNLIYVRVSGYGHNKSQGDIISQAGRDVNYLAASGLLSRFKRVSGKVAPVFPANVLTYYAGGSIYAITLILQALIESKKRTVIDCALSQGQAYLAQPELLK